MRAPEAALEIFSFEEVALDWCSAGQRQPVSMGYGSGCFAKDAERMNYDGMRREIEELFEEGQKAGRRRLDFQCSVIVRRGSVEQRRSERDYNQRVDRRLRMARAGRSLAPFWATIEAETKRRHAVEYARKRAKKSA